MYDDLAAKIRQRAYLIWEHENRPDGKDLEHWLRAEAEIKTDQSDATNQAEHPSPGEPTPSVAQTSASTTTAAFQATRKPKQRGPHSSFPPNDHGRPPVAALP